MSEIILPSKLQLKPSMLIALSTNNESPSKIIDVKPLFRRNSTVCKAARAYATTGSTQAFMEWELTAKTTPWESHTTLPKPNLPLFELRVASHLALKISEGGSLHKDIPWEKPKYIYFQSSFVFNYGISNWKDHFIWM
jgi:hypothetical protein